MNEDNENPGYWATITADVIFDDKLSSSEKLLYAVITLLQKRNGYCYATNAYFEKIFNTSERTIKYWLKSLETQGYISTKLTYKNGTRQIDKRLICARTTPTMQEFAPPSAKNCTTPSAKNCTENNNIFFNNKNMNKKEEKVCTKVHTKEETENLFEIFWTKYPRKQKKKDARKLFLKIVTPDNAKKIFDGLDMWLKSKQWSKNNGQYIPLPTSWLNEERWNDELKTSEIKDGAIEEFLNEDFDDDDIFGTKKKEGNYIDADFTTKA